MRRRTSAKTQQARYDRIGRTLGEDRDPQTGEPLWALAMRAAMNRTPATREALLQVPPTTVKQAAKRALRFKIEVYEHDALLNAARVQAFAAASKHCE